MSLKEMLNCTHVICPSAFALFHLSSLCQVKSLQYDVLISSKATMRHSSYPHHLSLSYITESSIRFQKEVSIAACL